MLSLEISTSTSTSATSPRRLPQALLAVKAHHRGFNANMDEDVSSLILGRYSGNEKDDFGKGSERSNVLLIDRTMELTRSPSSRLVQLPNEILADILNILADDKPTLASLALVNIECRQLARTAQFCDVNLDYSLQMQQLVRHLLFEVKECLNTPKKPNIGSCIRRINVASSQYYLALEHYDLYCSIFGDRRDQVEQEEVQRLCEEANRHYMHAWRDLIVYIVALATRNLEVLIWQDAFVLPDFFFSTLILSSVQHLKLKGVSIRSMTNLQSRDWPLQCWELDIHLSGKLTFGPDVIGEDAAWEELSSVATSILERCSSTLTSLTWSTHDMGAQASGGSPDFLQLRYFKTKFLSICPRPWRLFYQPHCVIFRLASLTASTGRS